MPFDIFLRGAITQPKDLEGIVDRPSWLPWSRPGSVREIDEKDPPEDEEAYSLIEPLSADGSARLEQSDLVLATS